MRWTIPSIALILTLAVAPTMAQGIGGFDTNGDGKIDGSEFPAGDRAFQRLDQNDDGYLTGDELSGLRQRLNQRRNQGQGGELADKLRQRVENLDANGDGMLDQSEFDHPQAFDRLDADGDGLLSFDELKAGARELLENRAPDGKLEQIARKLQELRRMDKDGDQAISPDEWTGEPAKFDELDADGDGLITREDLQQLGEARLEERFAEQDANGDGQLSPDEFPNPEVFDRLDADGNGTLSQEEAEAGVKRRMGQAMKQQRREQLRRMAQRLQQCDADGDGNISRTEWPGEGAKFDELDADGDGMLTREELKQRIQEKLGGGQEPE